MNLVYEPTKNPLYDIHSFDVMLIFQINAHHTYLRPCLVHFNVSIDNVLHSKYAIKVILKCTILGGMYGEH